MFTYDKKEDGTIVITDYLGEETEVTVPCSIEGLQVSEIGKEVFSLKKSGIRGKKKEVRKNITKIIIEDGIKMIGEEAFAKCEALETVILPDSLEIIGIGAFSGCAALSNIKIPPNVTVIKWAAFSGCTSLSEIIIPASVNELAMSCFSGCNKLKYAEIHGTVDRLLNKNLFNVNSLHEDIFGKNEYSHIFFPIYKLADMKSTYKPCYVFGFIDAVNRNVKMSQEVVDEYNAYIKRSYKNLQKKALDDSLDNYYELITGKKSVETKVEKNEKQEEQKENENKKEHFLKGKKVLYTHYRMAYTRDKEAKLNHAVTAYGGQIVDKLDEELDYLVYESIKDPRYEQAVTLKEKKDIVLIPYEAFMFVVTNKCEKKDYVSVIIRYYSGYEGEWPYNEKIIVDLFSKNYDKVVSAAEYYVANDYANLFEKIFEKGVCGINVKKENELIKIIDEYIDKANEKNSKNCLAWLINYKNSKFSQSDIEIHEKQEVEKMFGERDYSLSERFPNMPFDEKIKEQKLDVLKTAKIGDTVEFGIWPKGKNGKLSKIEWQVLKVNKKSLMLISKYVIDIQTQHFEKDKLLSQATDWINGEFFEKAFDIKEKSYIQEEKEMKVSLLSRSQAEKLLSTKDKRKTTRTPWVYESFRSSRHDFNSWVCSDKVTTKTVKVVEVKGDGSINDRALDFGEVAVGIRPVIFINLNEG